MIIESFYVFEWYESVIMGKWLMWDGEGQRYNKI